MEAPRTDGPARTGAETARGAPTASALPEPARTQASTAPEAPPRAAASPPPSPFPPPDFAPPSGKSAAEGDGHWTVLGDPALHERASGAPPVVARAVVHPHPSSRFITVTVAAVDLTHSKLALVPGTEDLAWAKLPVAPDSGLVPEAERGSLFAVMNGGFQPAHGHWGLLSGAVTVAPPKEGGCTIALYDDRVRVGPWESLAKTRDAMRALRQTPPCLVLDGAVHPSLLAGRDKAWAGHVADLKTRRRSALGIDSSGTLLFYAVGEEAEPRWLAEGLQVAGAAFAAELDINWYWTRFLLFGETAKGLGVTSTLIPKMEHLVTGYVARPSTRDFFYFVRK